MSNNNKSASNVRTRKNNRLYFRCSKEYKNVIENFCNENDMTISFFIDTLIRQFFKSRKIELKTIIRNWKGVDDMPANPSYREL